MSAKKCGIQLVTISLVFGVLMMALGILFAQPAQAVAQEGSTALSVMKPASVDYRFEFRGANNTNPAIWIQGVQSGEVTYDAGTKTVTLSNVTIDPLSNGGTLYADTDITVKLVGESAIKRIDAEDANITIIGPGTCVFLSALGHFDISCENLTVKGGYIKGASIGAGNFVMHDGSIVLEALQDDYSSAANLSGLSVRNFTMKGGNIRVSNNGGGEVFTGYMDAGLYVSGNFTMQGGSITATKNTTGILFYEDSGNFSMSGGTINCPNNQIGMYREPSSDTKKKFATYTMTNGSISVSNARTNGISLSRVNFKMTGGTVTVSNSGSGFGVGGTLALKGGAMSVVTLKPSKNIAVGAKKITGKMSCLKKVKGRLSTGALFKVGGCTYQVFSGDSVPQVLPSEFAPDACVQLVSYGAKKTSVKLDKVKYCGYTYPVCGVGANAFNTTSGKRVKSVVFKNIMRFIGNNAFANTKALTKLSFDLPIGQDYISYDDEETYTNNVWFLSGIKVGKKAFSKCGKKNGSGLTIYITANHQKKPTGYPAYKVDNKSYSKLLKKYGLASRVKIKAYS